MSSSWSSILRLRPALAMLQNREPDKPIQLIGRSMGVLIATQLAMQCENFVSLILAEPMIFVCSTHWKTRMPLQPTAKVLWVYRKTMRMA